MKFFNIPFSIKTVFSVGVPSSSMFKLPLLLSIVPSSIIVTPSLATFFPTKSWNTEVFFLLKSPSSPCPTASWIKIAGQPGPKTTFISPAGEALLSKFVVAIL